MNKIVINFIFIAMILLSYSCKDNTIESSTAIQLEGLTLNNNEKWIANEETHIGMKRIDSILKNNTSTNAKILGETLSKETSYVIKNCDMKGDAHDQLHVVLVPILEEITDLKDVTDSGGFKNKVSYLKGLINTYFKYFKT